MLEPAVKTQIMNEVDRQFDDQTRVLADLVKIPSTRFREAPAQDMMARLFKEAGLPGSRASLSACSVPASAASG